VLLPAGFSFTDESTGKGSGGEYSCGFYRRGDRALELHFRHSLGLVHYHIGPHVVAHADYMRHRLGLPGGNAYPAFSQDPLAGFHHLREDLLRFGEDFLLGDGQSLIACATTTPLRGLAALNPDGAA
jgi:hypothetical protein